MPSTPTVDRFDEHWARRLGCSVNYLRQAGIIVLAHAAAFASYHGVYALRATGDGTAGMVVSAPSSLVTIVRAALRGHTPEGAFDAGVLADAVRGEVERIIGPASISYADEADVRLAPEGVGVRRLTSADRPALESLRAACDPIEWEHGNISREDDVIFGSFAGDALVAVASWEARDDVRHIGVIAHLAHRGRGAATGVATAITSAALADGAIPQWQTLLSNEPSLAIARKLGYTERFRSIALRLTPKAATAGAPSSAA